jgi:CheY-like chemotaxis protein
MNGYDVARALRAAPHQPRPLLIALSGYGQEEDKQRALEAGFDWHLTKPVDPDVLRRRLEGRDEVIG